MKRWKSASNGGLARLGADRHARRRARCAAPVMPALEAIVSQGGSPRRSRASPSATVVGLLDAGQVPGARDGHQPRVRARGRPARPPGPGASSRPCRRPCTGSGTASAPRGGGEVGVADRGAAAEIALDRRAGRACCASRRARPRGARWKSGENQRTRMASAMLAMPPARIAADPLVPHLGRADLVGGVHEHEAAHQIGPGARQRLRDHAADREAADDGLPGPAGIEQRGQIPGERRSCRAASHRSGRGRACRSGASRRSASRRGNSASHTRQIRAQRVDQNQQRLLCSPGVGMSVNEAWLSDQTGRRPWGCRLPPGTAVAPIGDVGSKHPTWRANNRSDMGSGESMGAAIRGVRLLLQVLPGDRATAWSKAAALVGDREPVVDDTIRELEELALSRCSSALAKASR